MLGEMVSRLEGIVVWGLMATAALTVILQGSQGLGLSRLSLPFLVGTFFTGHRSRAHGVGFAFYIVGGWLFTIGYYLVFAGLGTATWWLGGVFGVFHGIFLLVVVLPLLPYFHPRMASEYDGPDAGRRLEPPGFMGLNYGHQTPVSTLIGHFAYGAILGGLYSLPF